MENIEVDTDKLNQKATPKWKNPPKLVDMKTDFTDASLIHSIQITKIREWLDFMNITGVAKPPRNPNGSNVAPKLVRKQAEWRYASLSEPFLSTYDLYRAAPVTATDTAAAEQNGALLNSQFNTKINKVAFVDEVVRALVDEGTVIVRVGWEFEEAEREVVVDDYDFIEDESQLEMHQQLNEMRSVSPGKFSLLPEDIRRAHLLSMANERPYRAQRSGSHIEKQMVTVKNNPTFDVCEVDKVVFDPTCKGDLSKAQFAIYTFEASKSDLNRAGIYQNVDNINVADSSILNMSDELTYDNNTFNFKDDARKKFMVHEYWGYWDIDGSGIVKAIVVSWVGDVIIRMEENPFPHKQIPFRSAAMLPVRNSIYGEPDAELLKDNQQIMGAVTRGMIDLLGKSANGQVGSAKGALDVTNRRKFDRGENYEYNPGSDPSRVHFMHKFAEIPQSAAYMLDQQNTDAESLTGVKAFSSGISGNVLGSTATGVRSVLDATSKRELGILRRVSKLFIDIGYLTVSMNQMFLDEQEIIRITDTEFASINRDDIQGDIDLRLTISTAEADNQKAEELAFMLQTTGQHMGTEFSQIILSEIATLRKMPDLARRIEEYQPAPDPMQQKIQELALIKLEAEIAEIAARTQEYQALAEFNMSRARLNGSSADKTDLDFIEQESGVKQERDLQKLGRQAESNMALASHQAMIDGAMKPSEKDTQK